AAALGLESKSDPALFLEAARRLGADPSRTAVIEDATTGVAAGRHGHFALVIGVDRTGHAADLRAAGADAVVYDLACVTVTPATKPPSPAAHPGEWLLSYAGYAPADEGRREALCTLVNGVFATRGAAPEATAGAVHYPGTYAAGFYNRLTSQVDGRTAEHESLVNLPSWLPLSFRPGGGDWLDLDVMQVAHYQQTLDLHAGILHRHFEVTDAAGRTTRVAERRLVHMSRPRIAALEWALTPTNWSGHLEIRSRLDGTVENRNVAAERALAGRHLTKVATGAHGTEVLWLTARTTQSERNVALACRTRVEPSGSEHTRHTSLERDRAEQLLDLHVSEGETIRVEKVAALCTSLDHAIADTTTAALVDLDDAGTIDELASSNERAWNRLWRRAHLELHGADPAVAGALNLHTFHVLATLSPNIVDRDVGVGARGLHGEGYRGHVFWDELFVFPYRTSASRPSPESCSTTATGGSRPPAGAAAMGCRGARFPWQSGSDGREETPTEFFSPRSGRWMADNSRRQHHVGLAVAYEVWQYHQVTADIDFLTDHGAELLVEIARFWADLAQLDPATRRYSIRGVMGPDEFHDGYPDHPGEGIDDNAYTNVMVSWLLRRALDAHQLLGDRGRDLWERLELGHDERDTWQTLSRRLHVPFRGDGMISQFAGYDDLAELDWDRYRDRYGNIGRLDLILEAEGDSTNRYKAAKQADVLMLLYLFSAEELTELLAHLGYSFDPAGIPATVDYYTARMTHGSTLCRVAMAWVLARADRARSWTIFRDALTNDIAD
ncbi:MAG TPA: hypothetical protein VMQ81_03290, partial [Acidimicrobiia bacterium]|nr:hypothetical protein [Acidimicrobiia bacterium]